MRWRFCVIADLFNKMARLTKKRLSQQAIYKFQSGISDELMSFRFLRNSWMLCATPCAAWLKRCRSERSIQDMCVVKGRMPRPHFIKVFRAMKTTCNGFAQELKAKKPTVKRLERYQHAIVEQQQRLLDLERRVGIPIKT